MNREFLTKTLGPGLLFAGAAVGVSHFVQSTRAGAVFGLGLLLIIIAANVIKYPAFSFGPRYAAATGTSLLEGYRRQGTWALVVYALVTLATMFTVQAAVTLVTAAILAALLDAKMSPDNLWWISLALMAFCAALLGVGKYRWLDRIIKVVVPALTILTVIATVLVIPRIKWSSMAVVPSSADWKLHLMFIAPLVGWMPSAIDISVWHSLWTLAKRNDADHAPSIRESLLDFKIGYIGTACLAVCFLLLGAGVLHGSGKPAPAGAVGFAVTVLNLYTETLGEWSRYLIGGCAVMVMFSTTLTVVDGFPRALSALAARFQRPEEPGEDVVAKPNPLLYWLFAGIIAIGSLIILKYYLKRFKELVDLATTISFFTAPVLAYLNHRAVTSPEIPADHRPSPGMITFSLACIGLLSLLAAWWLYVRFL